MDKQLNDHKKSRYVLVTPARNEERYIEKTIQSVISQTILPLKWVVVSDRSNDRTDDIVGRYANEHGFIELVKLRGNGARSFGAQVRAINSGYQRVKSLQFKYICNVDADVTFPDYYFEALLGKFEKDEKLGIGGGCIYESIRGVFSPRPHDRRDLVANAAQMFRRTCFEELGGYIELKYGAHDAWANVMARKLGWKVENMPELIVHHHRATASSLGRFYKGKWNAGLMDYTIGNHPLYQIIKCVHRVDEKPYIIASIVRMAAYIWAYVKREERGVSDDFIKYYRREQFKRIISLHE